MPSRAAIDTVNHSRQGCSATAADPAGSSSFVLTRQVRQGESLGGFVQWLCAENVVPRQADLFKLLTVGGSPAVRSIRDLAQEVGALTSLEQLSRQSPGTLARLRLRVMRSAVDDGEEDRIVQYGYEWPPGSRTRLLQPICSHCLQEDDFIRAEWEYAQAPVCLKHGVQLLEECGECGSPIRSDRATFSDCAACAKPLTDSVAAPVEDLVLTATRAVQAARVLAFGSETFTAPLEPQDLSGLLRLLLIPRFGESADYGLRADMESIPLTRRVEALQLLGSCFVGKRLDSERVRRLAQQRWPYAPLLVADEQSQLLLEAGRVGGLAAEVARMLCWNAETSPYPTAVEVYGNRPPRILTTSKLADHLGVEVRALAVLLSLERVATTNPADFGYDMDEVLRLERVLRSMPSTEEVDSLLGWPGLAKELRDMRLLQGLAMPDGRTCVHPRSLSQFLARIHERVGARACRTGDSMSLQDSIALGFDARQVAWAVAQVLGGSLDAHDWKAPFGLTSLFVCAQRLRELARWPHFEACEGGSATANPSTALT